MSSSQHEPVCGESLYDPDSGKKKGEHLSNDYDIMLLLFIIVDPCVYNRNRKGAKCASTEDDHNGNTVNAQEKKEKLNKVVYEKVKKGVEREAVGDEGITGGKER